MDIREHVQTIDPPLQASMDELLSELYHYRQQSERLAKVNELYRRMVATLDLPTMIETYSIWLMQYVPHELIGYNNISQGRMHMYCSSHGPERRHIINIAENLLNNANETREQFYTIDNFYSHTWTFEEKDSCGLLIMLRKDTPIPEPTMELINDSLAILAEPLKRALDYEEIIEQARKDPLTSLPNRQVFDNRIEYIIEHARRHKRPLTLAALDLDHFKEVNDTMGHLMGDKVLKQVAGVLQEQIRLTDLLVRMGGDEFLLVLPDTAMTAAHFLGERLCRAIKALDVRAGSEKLGVSIGLVEWKPGMSREQWLEKADDILYQAKADGRSRVAH